MAMLTASSPRRVYVRHGVSLTCFGGVYFGPKTETTSVINPTLKVRIAVLPQAGGYKRIQVSQGTLTNTVTEVWTEKRLTFATRGAVEEG